MTFQEAIEHYIGKNFYPREIIKQSISGFGSTEIEKNRVKVRSIVGATIEAMDNVIFMCKEGEKVAEEVRRELMPVLRGSVKLNEKTRRKKIEAWESRIFGLRRKIVTSHSSF